RRLSKENDGRLQVGETVLSPRIDPTWMRSFLEAIPSESLVAWDAPITTIRKGRAFRAIEKDLQDHGATSVLAINGREPSGDGVFLGVPAARAQGPVPFLYSRIAAHLATAGRLRRLHGDDVEAVMRPDGRVEDARDFATEKQARASLAQATAALD